jgi:predicted dinucleotide-binding enzyme
MKIAVLGTGMVGRAHAARLLELGHEVRVGTQDVDATRASTATGFTGETYAQWEAAHPGARLCTLADAPADADLVLSALNGQAAEQVLGGLADALAGQTLVDATNPLDFSTGTLTLTVCNTDSLGERIQRALPRTAVVKAFCTTTAAVQVNPADLGGGEHDMFVAGDDAEAKHAVLALMREYGWRTVHDLGGITGARGMEMMLPVWVGLMNSFGTAEFNYRIVR